MSGATFDPTPAPLLVACLCAGWCTACQAYAPVFAAVAKQFPDVPFAWVDIEEHSDALGEAALDIEDFPTLMLLRGDGAAFYGTVLPHPGTLTRMVEALRDGGALAVGQPCPAGFAAAVRRVGALALLQ
jgi:thiol-disulfide isomerase/thioredoxin